MRLQNGQISGSVQPSSPDGLDHDRDHTAGGLADENRVTGRDGGPSVLGNVSARQSWTDLGAVDHNCESGAEERNTGLSTKAGIILVCSYFNLNFTSDLLICLQGIHNIFVVIPQFLVTGVSSIIFAIFEPGKSVLHGQHPGKTNPAPSDVFEHDSGVDSAMGTSTLGNFALDMLRRQTEEPDEPLPPVAGKGPNSVAIIFR